ncbi:hypothetical protein QUA13_29715 [Microcoleus sp. S28C3]|uniref:hypothetical protein n=1 Tax=Microcoleus sp. S28C3 TaxID=3055414 RepID=UPI002FD0AD3A
MFQQIISKLGANGKRQQRLFYLNLLTDPFFDAAGIQKLLIAALFLVSQVVIAAAGLFG